MGNGKSRPQLQTPTEHPNRQSPQARPEPQTQEEQSDPAYTIIVAGISEALLEDLEIFFRHFAPMCSYLESHRERVFAQLLENHRLWWKAPPESSMHTIHKDVFPVFQDWQCRWFDFKLRMMLPQETSKFKFEYREGECELLYLQGIVLIGQLEDIFESIEENHENHQEIVNGLNAKFDMEVKDVHDEFVVLLRGLQAWWGGLEDSRFVRESQLTLCANQA